MVYQCTVVAHYTNKLWNWYQGKLMIKTINGKILAIRAKINLENQAQMNNVLWQSVFDFKP